MARLNNRITSANTRNKSTPLRSTDGASDLETSSAASLASDKENRSTSRLSTASSKRKSGEISRTGSASGREPSTAGSKRRRLDSTQRQSQMPSQRFRTDDRIDKQYYDPDQDQDERRATNRRLRDIGKTLNDSRAEYLKGESDGLVHTLRELTTVLPQIKQTSTATIDSRILVNVADISQKKVTELTLGDSSVGVDVDDFVSKCVAFMKKGSREVTQLGSTQTQRRARPRAADDEEEDSGDALNWDYLGRNACFLFNSRPCLSGFLLGPLSVQKKIRQPTQRRARERANPADALRPITLQDGDLEQQESANLTVICTEIATLLKHAMERGQAAVEANHTEDMSPEEAQALFRLHRIADNGLVPLFDFCVNPKSFGQTVENFFYISFLIKEGRVGFDYDCQGLPTLGISDQKSVSERQEAVRNQAVFKLDFETWEGIVKEFGIENCIIPHREEMEYDDGTNMANGRGWYD